PPGEMLGNIIHTEAGIPVSKKSILAGCFIRSANFIGAIDSGGVLRCNAPVPPGNIAAGAQNNQPIPETQQAPSEKPQTKSGNSEDHSKYLDKEKTKQVTFTCPLVISR